MRRLLVLIAILAMVLLGASPAAAHAETVTYVDKHPGDGTDAQVRNYHWADRTLTVVDRTRDPAWRAASADAVRVWNDVGARLELTTATGGSGCNFSNDIIPVCEENLSGGAAGGASWRVSAGHITGARIQVDTADFSPS